MKANSNCIFCAVGNQNYSTYCKISYLQRGRETKITKKESKVFYRQRIHWHGTILTHTLLKVYVKFAQSIFLAYRNHNACFLNLIKNEQIAILSMNRLQSQHCKRCDIIHVYKFTHEFSLHKNM